MDMELEDKEIVAGAVAENENLEKTEIHETEIEIITEMVTEIERVLSVTVEGLKKMRLEGVMLQSYPMRPMSN
jgi:hypothetical protein